MRTKKPRGIRPWRNGWQAYVRVNTILYSKSFPIDTPLPTMRTWQLTQRVEHAHDTPKTAPGTLAGDIDAYLKRVASMPTYKQRKAHLEIWKDAIGGQRRRASITAGELEVIMQGWLSSGVAPATVRKRRSALLAMWHRLDGREASNVVRASAAPREPRPEIRAIDYATIQRIIDAMPESVTKRRVAVIAWTGLPPSILNKVTPADIDFAQQTIRVMPRRKGAGAPARVLPLLAQAVTELRAFHKAHAYGPFETGPLNVSFKRACNRLEPKVTGVRLYDLRHSFATMMYRVTKDLATTARFLLHSRITMTERYAQAANADIDRTAAEAADVWLQGRKSS